MSMPSKPSPSLLLPTGQGEGKQSIIASGKPIREITFAQAINEALAEEMRRDPKVFIIGEDVAEAGTPFKVLSGLVREFGRGGRDTLQGAFRAGAGIRQGAGDRFTDLGSGNQRYYRRCRDDGNAAGRRHHVRRFYHAYDGSNGQSGGEDPLYVRRQTQGADGDADDLRGDAPVGSAAQPKPARVVQPHSRLEGRAAGHAVRRQGIAQDSDPG